MASAEPGLDERIFGGAGRSRSARRSRPGCRSRSSCADRIESGRLGAGERLPPERDLAEALSVSRMTVRQALASLAARGLVERGVGRGTFVREARPVLHDLTRVAGFTAEVERQGLEAGARILEAIECPAPEQVARGARRSRPARRSCGSSASGSAAAGR